MSKHPHKLSESDITILKRIRKSDLAMLTIFFIIVILALALLSFQDLHGDILKTFVIVGTLFAISYLLWMQRIMRRIAKDLKAENYIILEGNLDEIYQMMMKVAKKRYFFSYALQSSVKSLRKNEQVHVYITEGSKTVFRIESFLPLSPDIIHRTHS